MIKRLLAILALAFSLAVLPTAANATPSTPKSTWFCIGIGHLNLGVCQGNPLPALPI